MGIVVFQELRDCGTGVADFGALPALSRSQGWKHSSTQSRLHRQVVDYNVPVYPALFGLLTIGELPNRST